ncbi:MAG: hypothetical protein K8I02_09020, partial [Candidatus Methylomirabilis sp.]|nr:hypothetical protein [Deltaproteobacteria bacterium]
ISMRLYLYKTGRTLSPFGDAVGESLILNETLRAHQERLAGELGLEIAETEDPAAIPDADFFLLYDHVFCSRRLARRFAEEARKAGETRGLAIERCGFTAYTATLMDTVPVGEDALGYHFYYVKGGALGREALEAAPRTTLAIGEKVITPENYEILGHEGVGDRPAITREGVAHVTHWSHLLTANQMGLAQRFLDFDAGKLAFYLWRLLTAFPWGKHRILRRVSRIGRGCDIHPTARVEASILGDGVKVGPYCWIFGSVIGAGTKVDAQSSVVSSVIGERCVISFRTAVSVSVLYPRSMASMPAMQLTVLGRQAVQLAYGLMMDVVDPFGRKQVGVKHEGKVVPSGQYFLGCALGHGATLGAGVWVRAGNEIPNGAFLVQDQADVFYAIPDSLPAHEP